MMLVVMVAEMRGCSTGLMLTILSRSHVRPRERQ